MHEDHCFVVESFKVYFASKKEHSSSYAVKELVHIAA